MRVLIVDGCATACARLAYAVDLPSAHEWLLKSRQKPPGSLRIAAEPSVMLQPLQYTMLSSGTLTPEIQRLPPSVRQLSLENEYRHAGDFRHGDHPQWGNNIINATCCTGACPVPWTWHPHSDENRRLRGDYVIASKGESETTVKQLSKDGADFYLKPLNTPYSIKPARQRQGDWRSSANSRSAFDKHHVNDLVNSIVSAHTAILLSVRCRTDRIGPDVIGDRTMPLDTAQLLAKLRWEAACERFRNALHAPNGAPESTPAERLAAYRLVQEALEAARQAFEIDAAEHLAHSDCPADPRPMAMPAEQCVHEPCK